jgi:hypothetical protein
MTMCLPFRIAAVARRMPVFGSPVASTMTSISGCAIMASASSVRNVRPVFAASARELALDCSSGQDAVFSWERARATFRSATATTCRPSVVRAWARNIVPNLPAPTTPTVTGRPWAWRSSSIL